MPKRVGARELGRHCWRSRVIGRRAGRVADGMKLGMITPERDHNPQRIIRSLVAVIVLELLPPPLDLHADDVVGSGIEILWSAQGFGSDRVFLNFVYTTRQGFLPYEFQNLPGRIGS